jgi:hypothetical protein
MSGVLPADCTRCVGVSTDEGELVAPCNTCKRILWARPTPERAIWVGRPPRDKLGRCPLHWHIEQGET